MAKKPILTLDIGAHSLKLAEFIEVKGGLEMTRYAVSALGIDPQSDADQSQYIITTIHDLLRESGCRPGPVQLSISGQKVFSRFVKLPPVDPDKVFQIIQYEAQQNVPFPINEVVWDYQLISGPDGDVDVMLAAIKSDIIENLADCARFAGLTPNLVDMAPMALYNAVRYNYDNLPPCTLVVDIGARSTDLIFLEAGRVFSRSVPVAGNQITQALMTEFSISFDDAEELKKAQAFVAFGGAYEGPKSETADKVAKSVRGVMTRLHQEINRSINFYRSQQGGQAPELLLLTGGSSVIPFTDTFFREKLRVDTDYFNPFNNVAVAEQIPAEQIGHHACVMGQLVGLALRGQHTCPIEVNLMPPKALEEKRFESRKPLFFAAAGVFLLCLLVWTLFFIRIAVVTEDVAEKVDTRVNELSRIERTLQTQEADLAATTAKIGRLVSLAGRRGQWRDWMNEINVAMPAGMWLTSIKPMALLPGEVPEEVAPPPPPRRGVAVVEEVKEPLTVVKAIEIKGMGYRDKLQSSEEISYFRDRLRASPLFSDETSITWQPPATEEFAMEFTILVILETPQSL